MTQQNQIPVLELKRLLHALKDRRPDIGVRFRLIGEMWQPRHLQVFQITEKGLVLRDTETSKLIIIPDLSQVMQFELDDRFQQYTPHFHYAVDPVMVRY